MLVLIKMISIIHLCMTVDIIWVMSKAPDTSLAMSLSQVLG